MTFALLHAKCQCTSYQEVKVQYRHACSQGSHASRANPPVGHIACISIAVLHTQLGLHIQTNCPLSTAQAYMQAFKRWAKSGHDDWWCYALQIQHAAQQATHP